MWCVVCGVWCVVCGVWCVVCGVWCVVCGVWCVVCGVWCVVCGVWCVVCGVWCVVCGVWCVVCGVCVCVCGCVVCVCMCVCACVYMYKCVWETCVSITFFHRYDSSLYSSFYFIHFTMITGRRFSLRSDRLTLEINSPTRVNHVSLYHYSVNAVGSRWNSRRYIVAISRPAIKTLGSPITSTSCGAAPTGSSAEPSSSSF